VNEKRAGSYGTGPFHFSADCGGRERKMNAEFIPFAPVPLAELGSQGAQA